MEYSQDLGWRGVVKFLGIVFPVHDEQDSGRLVFGKLVVSVVSRHL